MKRPRVLRRTRGGHDSTREAPSATPPQPKIANRQWQIADMWGHTRFGQAAQTMKGSITKKLIGLLLTCLLIVLMLRWFEHSQVYHPDRVLTATGAELGRPFEDVRFRASDGVELNGWFSPGTPNSPRAGFAFLFCHGTAGNITPRLDPCPPLLAT